MTFFALTNSKDTPDVTIFQDLGYRGEQQDRYVVVRLHTGLLLAVMDGHGGHSTCSLVAKYLALYFSEELEKAVNGSIDKDIDSLNETKLKKVIQQTVNRLIALTKAEFSGSTLTLVFIEQGYRSPDYLPAVRVTTAQMGDSICVINAAESGHFIMTPVHSTCLQKDDLLYIQRLYFERFEKECKVSHGYLYSAENPRQGVALTRALGDCEFVLLRKPEIDSHVLPKENLTLFLASDGVLTSEACPEHIFQIIINKIVSGQSAAEIGASFNRLDDNTTLLCVAFR